jgi:alpha-mannosidase
LTTAFCARIDPASGNLVELVLHDKSGNLIDTSKEAGNQYIFVEGKDFDQIRKTSKLFWLDGPDIGNVRTSGPARISVEEDGPLIATLRIESATPHLNERSVGSSNPTY